MANKTEIIHKLKSLIADLEANLADRERLYRELSNHVRASRWVKIGSLFGLTQLDQATKDLSESEVVASSRAKSTRENLAIAQQELESLQRETMEFALAHLAKRGIRPAVILDVGAFKGYWSEYACFFFPEARFYLIEALPVHEPELQALCQKKDNFQYLICGVGDQEGELVMNINKDSIAGSSLLSLGRPQSPEDLIVKVHTLDRLLVEGKIEPPQLVKMDIQGYELKALEGGQKLFETAEVFILEASLFEFMPGQPLLHEVIDYMAQRDYSVFDIADPLRRPCNGDLGQIDLVFARNNSPLRSSNRWL